MWGGTNPSKFWELRSNMVTLRCLWPHVTPYHSQMWLVSFHELKTRPGSAIRVLNSNRASRSILCPPASNKGETLPNRRMIVVKHENDLGETRSPWGRSMRICNKAFSAQVFFGFLAMLFWSNSEYIIGGNVLSHTKTCLCHQCKNSVIDLFAVLFSLKNYKAMTN